MLNHMMFGRAGLAAGDVVIRAETQDGGVVYLMRIVPGPDQLSFRTREQAVAYAIEFARRQAVGAWLIDQSGDCELLNDLPATPESVRAIQVDLHSRNLHGRDNA